MKRLVLAIALLGTSATALAATSSPNRGTDAGAESMVVDHNSDARQVLVTVPAGSALERFEAMDRSGHVVSYVALTETPIGGLLFLDQKLLGSVTHDQAQAFYSCRGYVTSLGKPWVADAGDWIDSLVARAQPVEKIQLTFSGTSTSQSIQQLVSNPALSQLNSLISMGTNPLNIFKRLNEARNNEKARQRYEREKAAMLTLKLGSTEQELVDAAQTQEIGFLTDGLIMAYPTHLVEFYLSKQSIQVIQQPSFYHLARVQPAAFYVVNANWTQCTPQTWQNALKHDAPAPRSPP